MNVCRLVWCFLAGVLCTPNAWSQGVRAVDIFVMDPGKFVQQQLKGDLSGSSGVRTSIDFRDDGHAPDQVAQDGIYSARAQLGDHAIHIDFQSQARRWSVDTTLPSTPGDTAIRLRLGPERGVVVVHDDEPMLENHVGGTNPSSGGSWLWVSLFLGVGVGVGLGLTRLRHVPIRPADVAGDVPVPDWRPSCVDSSRCDSLIAGLASNHLVVVLGESVSLDNVVYVTTPRVTPVELIRRVEMLAVKSGGEVALVVGDLSRVEVEGSAAAALDEAVAQRFQLWVVGGPKDWPTYEAAGTS